MNTKRFKISFVTASAGLSLAVMGSIVFAQEAHAATKPFSIYDSNTKKVITCAKQAKGWEPGKMSSKTKLFTSFRKMIKELDAKMKDAIEPKKSTMKAQRQKMAQFLAAQVRLCKNAAKAAPSPDPEETPRTSPKPTNTPTPGGGSGCSQPCYTSSGTTQCFNIPSSVSGSKSNGSSLFSRDCAGCHASSSKANRTYSQIASSFSSISLMIPLSSRYRTQEIADITAFLNQNNSKNCKTNW